MDLPQASLLILLTVLTLVNLFSLTWLPVMISRKIKQQQLTTSKTYDLHVDDAQVLSEIDLAEVEQEARKQLQEVAKMTVERLQKSLTNTVDQISVNISDMTNTQLSQEFEKYQVSLQALRDQTITEFTKVQKELDQRKTQLLENLDREVAIERKKRVEQLDTRINDVVASYLTETLGNQVDLGAQSTYIFASLEAHKEDIKRDILS
jgi:hypothetical protein